MPDGFRSIKDVFYNEPGLKKVRNTVKDFDITNDFSKIFPELSKIVSSVKTNSKTLILKVDNPAWRQELKTQEENIIKKINSFYQEERIVQLRFTN